VVQEEWEHQTDLPISTVSYGKHFSSQDADLSALGKQQLLGAQHFEA